MPHSELEKKYYKISEVSDMLDLSTSTLRYWEAEFPELKPMRTATKRRFYTPADIETLRMIHYLVKIKGMHVQAARAEMLRNRTNVSKRLEVMAILRQTRDELNELLTALTKRK